MKKASNKQRLEVAFHVAKSNLGIARLLDAKDVDIDKPDEKSIMNVAQFLQKYPEPKVRLWIGKARFASNISKNIRRQIYLRSDPDR